MRFEGRQAFETSRRRAPVPPSPPCPRVAAPQKRPRPEVLTHKPRHAPVGGRRPTGRFRRRWLAAAGFAALLHAALLLLILWINPHLSPPFEPVPAPEERPMFVELREYPPEDKDGVVPEETAGKAATEELTETLEAAATPPPPSPQPRQPTETPAADEPTEPQEAVAEAAPPASSSPRAGNPEADDRGDAPLDARRIATAVARRQNRPYRPRPPAAQRSTAPQGVCSSSFTSCIYDNGAVLEVSREVAAQMAEGSRRGSLVALSDQAFDEQQQQHEQQRQALRQQARQSASSETQVYSNYGVLKSLQKVDLQRLAAAAQGAPYSCSVYPNALNQVDEDPSGLTIIIDSSGSMIENMYSSPATQCAYAATRSALDNGIPVSVINFSEKLYYAEASMDEQRIAEVICKQQKSSTKLPEEQLEELVAPDGRRDLMLISDGVIANTDTAMPHLESVLRRHVANQGFAMLLNAKPSGLKMRDDLHAIGFRVTMLRF